MKMKNNEKTQVQLFSNSLRINWIGLIFVYFVQLIKFQRKLLSLQIKKIQ